MKRILNFIMLLTIIAGSASAQSLSVQPIEAKKGGQAELSVSLTGGTAMTALQFNLQLPAGLTATTDNVTLGAATDGHSLSVETLDSGDLLFVLYSMDLNTFMDGELLRIPVTVSEGAASGEGQLYTVRLATADAVSVSANDVTITSSIAKPGDVNGDGDIDIADAVCVVNYIVGNPTPTFVELAADANGDDDIDIADAVTIVNYIVGNPSSLSPETTYYWYAGQTDPSTMTSIHPVIISTTDGGGWYELGTTVPETIQQLIKGGDSTKYWYVAVPITSGTTLKPVASDMTTLDTSVSALSTKVFNNITYQIYWYGGFTAARNTFRFAKK